jgi:creatinine amidohydrolase
MSSPRLLLNELTRTDLRNLAPTTLVILPVGATEQHGPHLPVGTDSFAVEYVARAVAELVSPELPLLVAPTLPFGSSHHHLPFGGTLSLGTETYYRVLTDLIESLIVGGFRRVFILNGHGGNHELTQLVARDVARTHSADLAAASYWVTARDALATAGADSHADVPGHAGAFETSLVMALRPELVGEPRPHRDQETDAGPSSSSTVVRSEFHGYWERIDGFTDSPVRADAERGRVYVDAIVPAVAAAVAKFYRTSAGSVG